jgi:hypothetical protein
MCLSKRPQAKCAPTKDAPRQACKARFSASVSKQAARVMRETQSQSFASRPHKTDFQRKISPSRRIDHAFVKTFGNFRRKSRPSLAKRAVCFGVGAFAGNKSPASVAGRRGAPPDDATRQDLRSENTRTAYAARANSSALLSLATMLFGL